MPPGQKFNIRKGQFLLVTWKKWYIKTLSKKFWLYHKPFYKKKVKNSKSRLNEEENKGNNKQKQLFRILNLNNFVSFQYLLMKFCMKVPEIKLNFFFSSCYYNFWETKKLYRKNSNFWHFFTFSPFFCKLWTLITFSIFIGSLWNLVCCFLLFHSIFSTFNVVIICQK